MKKILCSLCLLLGPLALQAQAPFPPAASKQNSIDWTSMVPVLEGDSKVTLTMGTFDTGNTRMSASSWVPVVGIFTNSTITPIKAMGEYSETKAPSNLKRIRLTGYSTKSMGAAGTVLLCKAKVDEGNRYVRLKNMEVEKAWWKDLADVAKLTQSPEGGWAFEIQKPLEAGHYLVTFLKMPNVYWDFDVR